MEGIQPSAPVDLSSVVCYYKTINYPSLDISTDSSTRRFFDLKHNKRHAAEMGYEEVSNGLAAKGSTNTEKLLSNGIKVSSTVTIKKSVQSIPTVQNTSKEANSTPKNPLQSIASLVIKNGELLTSSGSTLKLYLVPASSSSSLNKPAAKLAENKKTSTVEDLLRGSEKTNPVAPSPSHSEPERSPVSSVDEDMEVEKDDEINNMCCKLCGALSQTEEEFEQHIATHAQNSTTTTIQKNCNANDLPKRQNQIRHQCPLCSASFARKYRLTIHIRTHTGEKPYRCSICEKTFKDSDHLRRHVRTHSGLKPFKCELCSRTFVDREHLKRHLNVHYSGGRVRAVLE